MSSNLEASRVAVLVLDWDAHLVIRWHEWMDSHVCCNTVLSSRLECLYRWFKSLECVLVSMLSVLDWVVYLGFQWPEWWHGEVGYIQRFLFLQECCACVRARTTLNPSGLFGSKKCLFGRKNTRGLGLEGTKSLAIQNWIAAPNSFRYL